MYNVKAYAKINIFLDILGKRPDGYHELITVMHKIKLHDNLYFKIMKRKSDDKINNIHLSSNKSYLPNDERNLCYKAIKYFKTNFNIEDEIYLNIYKKIPTSAGMGGGSSDFYSTIDFLNKYYKLKLTQKELIDISNKFGSDIAFFSYGGTCLCEGRGEIITPLKTLSHFNVYTKTPNVKVSTKEIFSSFDMKLKPDYKKQTSILLDSIKHNKLDEIYKNAFNVLELVTIKKHPIIKKIKNFNYSQGAKLSLMSGSGPTVFSIY